MSKITDGFEKSELLDVIDAELGGQNYLLAKGLLDHARALEGAMSVLLPIVQDAMPKLDLSNFDKLLE